MKRGRIGALEIDDRLALIESWVPPQSETDLASDVLNILLKLG